MTDGGKGGVATEDEKHRQKPTCPQKKWEKTKNKTREHAREISGLYAHPLFYQNSAVKQSER